VRLGGQLCDQREDKEGRGHDPVGNEPYGVAVNPLADTIYVTNNNSTVSVISGQTNTVVASVPVGLDPLGVAVNPATNTIYVANLSPSTGSVISGQTDTVAATILLISPYNTEPWGGWRSTR
jgi:YVTN family beta-propeller protein